MRKTAITRLKYSGGMMSLKRYQMTEFTHMLKNWKMNIVTPSTNTVIVSGVTFHQGWTIRDSTAPNCRLKANNMSDSTRGGSDMMIYGIRRPHLPRRMSLTTLM